MLEQRCPVKKKKKSITTQKTKTDEVTCGLFYVSCSALNIPVVWQWRWWAKRATDSLSTTRTLFFLLPPVTLKDPDSLRNCSATSHFPLFPPKAPNANRWGDSRGRTLAGNQQTSGFTVLSVRKPPLEKRPVRLFICLSVWPIDHPITTIALPEIAVRDYLFLVNLIFFLSGLTFH